MDSVFLIANDANVDVQTPYEVIPGLQLRKASDEETSILQDLVAKACSGNIGWTSPYEMNWIRGDSAGYQSVHLEDSSLWKYWVLVGQKGGSTVHGLERIMQLVEPVVELATGIYFSEKDGQKKFMGHSGVHHHIANRHWGMDAHFRESKTVVSEVALIELRQLFGKLNGLSEQHLFIENSLRIFNDIQRVPERSDLRVVGYFSVIESLITHAPRLTETLDSISHQIRGKMALLNNQFNDPVAIPEGFDCEMLDKKRWSKLYAYRSKIAHGQSPSFQGELSPLKDRVSVCQYLENTCRSLLKFALNEPQLIMDIREC